MATAKVELGLSGTTLTETGALPCLPPSTHCLAAEEGTTYGVPVHLTAPLPRGAFYIHL